MKRLSFALVVAFVGLGSGCGARPDLLEGQEGAGAGVASGGSGGSANGGSANGGSANGGSANGGSANGGSANGGSANGGSANGGSANGGATVGGGGNGGVAGGGNGGVGGNGGAGGAGNGGNGGVGGGNGGVGGAGGNGGAGGGQICPGLGDQCTSCLSTGCPERYCNCYDNKECFALFQCANKCGGDMNCLDGCYQKHAAGFSDASLLTDCAATTCQAACPGANQPLTPCNSCILQSCDKEMNACVGDGNCLQLYQCLTSCGQLDLTCQDNCYKKYPGSIMTLQALLQCTQNDCSNPCKQ